MIDYFEEDIKAATNVLQKGGVILYPTDTVWGLGCDATNSKAVDKIYTIKNRDDKKALIVLTATEKQIIKHSAAVDLDLFNYLETTLIPTTVIYDHAIGFAPNLIAENGSIAMRICRDNFCKSLIKRFGNPIVSSSANISGKPTPTCFKEINSLIKEQIDYIVKYRQQDETPGRPSSIIKWKDGKCFKIR